ncbi:polysaccharide deacetylase family protein [Candidatus Nomurabacteria bacterium]|nr:polysaccharide deacetylase family protein [Candidatus Kaiserbacteria bacterium]MCB9813958.1 polysaccharide deacetylase family protein [Candidatus Nomurabacteria bacterium]
MSLRKSLALVCAALIIISSIPSVVKAEGKVPNVESSQDQDVSQKKAAKLAKPFENKKPQVSVTTSPSVARSFISSASAVVNENLIPNGDLEDMTGEEPTSWGRGGYGQNVREYTYPVAGSGGIGKAAQVSMSEYTDGDARWYFTPLTLSPGEYVYTDIFSSDIPTIIELQLKKADGSYSYTDIKFLTATNGFETSSVNFVVPAGTQDVTVYHLIQEVGTLTLDSATLTAVEEVPPPPPPVPVPHQGIFQTGGVSLRFDDGWLSQYTAALPAIKEAGFKATFYITTQQIFDNGYDGFVSIQQIKNLYADGMEIGNHTRTHPHLTDLTARQQKAEITGASKDLASWGIPSVASVAYPYGEYNNTTINKVKKDGLKSGATTNNGSVNPYTNPYVLNGSTVLKTDSVANVKNRIDAAMENKEWLILSFHRIDYSGDLYSYTPEDFSAVIDYLKSQKVPVVTVSTGVKDLEV